MGQSKNNSTPRYRSAKSGQYVKPGYAKKTPQYYCQRNRQGEEIMADRAVHQARHDSDGDITAIGAADQPWSPRLKQEAINDIESGAHRYYVPWKNDPHTWIRVVDGPTGKYLRTDRDTTARNNLDDLPEC